MNLTVEDMIEEVRETSTLYFAIVAMDHLFPNRDHVYAYCHMAEVLAVESF